jgi:hypothetical protein
MTRSLLASAAALLLAPAAASAATTYTVDAGAGHTSCSASLCGTITAALANTVDGDTVHIRAGTYAEQPLTVADAVRIEGEPGTLVTTATGAAGTPVFKVTHDGVTITGLSAANAPGGGAVVLSQAHDLVLDGVILTRTSGTADAAVVEIDGTPAGGTTTIAHALIVNAVAATGQSRPAIAGGPANSLVVSDSLVVSGAGQGPGIVFAGGDTAANRIVRSTVEAIGTGSDAVYAQSTTAGAKQLVVDSSVLSGGASAASLHATTSNSVPGAAVGDLDVRLTHATLAGAAKAVAAEASANGALSPVGSIAVGVERSIVRGTITHAECAGCPFAANTATIALTGSDSPATDFFVNAGAGNYHLRADAPVIDKGGPAVGGESDTDVDGQPRVAGAASDLGADEFVNQPPVGRLAAPAAVRQPAAVSFDASASGDPEAASGGGIANYHFVFGDGSSIDSASPTVTHVYANPGVYAARVTATDVQGLAGAASDPVTAEVADGVAPTVRIVSPKNRAKVRLRTSKRKLAPIRFFGSAADDHGVAAVALTLRQVTKGSKCRFFDGKRSFKTVPCAQPVVIRVRVQQGIWTYKVKNGVRLRKGAYELSAYAVDQGANVSKPARIRFTLK